MKRKAPYSEARQKIIAAALDLFYRQGYLATGINQVIAEAGVSKNTFYYYFPSKEDLCITYLQERHKVWMGWLREEIDSHESPYERVISVFKFLEVWLTRCNFRGCAFLNIASEVPDLNHRIRKEVVAHKDSLRDVFTDILKTLKNSNRKYAKIDPAFLSDILYVLFEGAISACQNYGDVVLIDAARSGFTKLLEHRK
jgi:AcrR family transcriptional regulator